MTSISEEEEAWDPIHDGNQPNDYLSAEIKKTMPGSAGLPVSVQVASLPFREEIVIRVMREIEQAIQSA